MGATPNNINKATADLESSSKKPLLDMDETEYEELLMETFQKAKRLARTNDNDETVLLAKLASLAIRQLHASGVVSIPSCW